MPSTAQKNICPLTSTILLGELTPILATLFTWNEVALNPLSSPRISHTPFSANTNKLLLIANNLLITVTSGIRITPPSVSTTSLKSGLVGSASV